MSSGIYHQESTVIISAENARRAFAAIKAGTLSRRFYGDPTRWRNLADILDDQYFILEYHDDGSISKIKCEDEASFAVQEILEALAPYIEDDGYIEADHCCEGRFRYVFKHGQLHTIDPIMTWPEVT